VLCPLASVRASAASSFFLPIGSGNTIERINLDGTDSDQQILESMDSCFFLTWIDRKLDAMNKLDSNPSRACNLISILPMKKRKLERQPQPFLGHHWIVYSLVTSCFVQLIQLPIMDVLRYKRNSAEFLPWLCIYPNV
jgi:hypothetical protein